MDKVSRAFWETCFQNRYFAMRSTAFQDLFWDIMERRYPGDFQRVQPWGRMGDRKNDGYLASEKCIFQCYAPKRMDANDALNKIDEDYDGALKHWAKYFARWTFVHNEYDGLPPQVLERLLYLTASNPAHAATAWGYPELRDEVMKLDPGQLSAMFGDAPTVATMLSLGFDDLRPLVEVLIGQDPSVVTAIRPVPVEKLETNRFSQAVRHMIEYGLQRSALVEDFFQRHYDPTLHDHVAARFGGEYVRLRGEGRTPDEIFNRLVDIVGGVGPANVARHAAVFAILAYFFEICEIFEPHNVSGEELTLA